MIVLHGAWLPERERLALWAEDGGRPRVATPRRGRPARRPRPRPHPFAVGSEGVRAGLAALGAAAVPDAVAGDPAELLLRLPERDGGPAASPWLDDRDPTSAAPPASSGTEPPPARWSTPGLVLGWWEVAAVLPALRAAGGEDGYPAAGSPEVALAADLRFAALVTELVLELVTRGRVLPVLEATAQGWRSRWRPVLDRHDRSRVAALAWSLPASFAAATIADADAGAGVEPADPGPANSGPTPAEVLRSCAWAMTDAVTRQLAGPGTGRPSRRRPRTSAAAGSWLASLTGPDGAVGADDELAALAGRVEAWWATGRAFAEPVRTCFRVVPPDDDTGGHDDTGGPDGHDGGDHERGADTGHPDGGGAWTIEFAVQAVDDPSLVVPAATVWADGPELTALARHAAHPDEQLLRGLGRAARLVPALGAALASPTPCELPVDAAGILAFLRDGAPLLEEAGFGVLAPPWWRSTGSRLRLRLNARAGSSGRVTSGGLGLDSLCDVRWEAVLGDDTMGVAELRQLARLKQPLVRMRGQWVELHEDELAAAISAVGRRGAAARLSAGDVLRTALGLGPAAVDGLAVDGVVADGWLGELLDGADRRVRTLATPEAFEGRLRPYQERGLAWLDFLGELGLGACLADDMGLGKTAQLLALLVHERRHADADADAAGPTLVLCPMSLVGNWQREAARFAPSVSVYVHHGTERLSGAAFGRHAGSVDLVLSTYGLAARDQADLCRVPWRRIVLDEAQQIKNSAARTTRSVRAIPAPRRIAMTGTPVENRLSELWSIMAFLNPGLLGSEKGFRERFAVPIERHGDDEAAARLRRITEPFVLRRLKTDPSVIADLPEKLEMKEYCNLTREQATLYQAVVDDMLARVNEAEGIERRGLVLATMLKLKQVCNHPAQFLGDGSALGGRSGKVARLVEVLEEAVAEGDRSLVFTQFTVMGDLLARHLGHRLGREVLWLHGGVRKPARDAMVDRFQRLEAPVFLLSLKAGGTGLNLTAATNVVHFDRWWNPAVEDQATDRAFRIGQHRNVQVRKFICGGTLEERIDEMIESKRALADRIVGSGEGWLTELSTEQLREVVALSADAVGED